MGPTDLKQTISLRLADADRLQVQALAARLFVRESDIYRLAIGYLLNRFGDFLNPEKTGSDLLPAFLQARVEMNDILEVRRHQLENILNGNNARPEKYIAMSDIELLMLPRHLLRSGLMKADSKPRKNLDAEAWLALYLSEKYQLELRDQKSPNSDTEAV